MEVARSYHLCQGFKSTTLGASAGEIGILNTTSGLLVLWIGMFLVLKGELTLGMLIAFRIISRILLAYFNYQCFTGFSSCSTWSV